MPFIKIANSFPFLDKGFNYSESKWPCSEYTFVMYDQMALKSPCTDQEARGQTENGETGWQRNGTRLYDLTLFIPAVC